MEGFFTFVLVLILLFWLLGRVAPFILAWWVRKKFRGMEQEHKRYTKANRDFKEGDVLVEVEKEDRKVVDSSVGEYVDFEETK
jgi:hypothetical protein